jgi:hypothetical protein
MLDSNIVINFDKSIRTATLSMANWNVNHTINWASVKLEVEADLAKYYGYDDIEAIVESDFAGYMEETEDWMENCSVTTFEKFEYLTVYHNL